MATFVSSITSGARAITNAGQRLAVGGGGGAYVRVYNIGTNKVAVLAGDGTQLAAMPTDNAAANGKGAVIAPGQNEVLRCPAGYVDIHAITEGAETATIYAQLVSPIPGA